MPKAIPSPPEGVPGNDPGAVIWNWNRVSNPSAQDCGSACQAFPSCPEVVVVSLSAPFKGIALPVSTRPSLELKLVYAKQLVCPFETAGTSGPKATKINNATFLSRRRLKCLGSTFRMEFFITAFIIHTLMKEINFT